MAIRSFAWANTAEGTRFSCDLSPNAPSESSQAATGFLTPCVR